MKYVLATLNAGNVLCGNARASFQAAAERWDAAYVELVPGRNTPMSHPLLCKLRLFEFTDADRLFYIDGADAIIREDAPSPFEICPPDMMGVVRNAHESYPDYFDVSRQERREWKRVGEVLGRPLKQNRPYFNAGMMVMTRTEHARLLDRAYEVQSQTQLPLKWREQTLLNYVVEELDVPLLFMDHTWNCLHPERAQDWAWMEHYVYHFAGLPERYSTLPATNWRTPPPGWKLSKTPCRASRRVRLRNALRRIPLIGSLFRYVYWCLSLPSKVNHLTDQVHILSELTQGTRYLLNNERRTALPNSEAAPEEERTGS